MVATTRNELSREGLWLVSITATFSSNYLALSNTASLKMIKNIELLLRNADLCKSCRTVLCRLIASGVITADLLLRDIEQLMTCMLHTLSTPSDLHLKNFADWGSAARPGIRVSVFSFSFGATAPKWVRISSITRF